MTQPFIIFSLPRSRSFWLSRALSYANKWVGHDLTVQCSSTEDFKSKLASLDGTVETAAVTGWQIIRQEMPQAKLVLVRRPCLECWQSMNNLGWLAPVAEFQSRSYMLDALAQQPGVMSFDWDTLGNPLVGEWMFKHLLDLSFDEEWWAYMASQNLQINLAQRMQTIQMNHDNLASLKLDLAGKLRALGGLGCPLN